MGNYSKEVRKSCYQSVQETELTLVTEEKISYREALTMYKVANKAA